MSFGGWLIALLALLVGAFLTPALIRRRQRIVHTPVEDRFSDRLHLLRSDITPVRVSGERSASQPRLVDSQVVWRTASPNRTTGSSDEVEGEEQMATEQRRQVERDSERPVRSPRPAPGAATSVPTASRELARLRARRAARIASEKAGAQRRFAVILACLAAVVALMVAAFYGTVSAWFLTVPVLGIAATFAWGHAAYRRSVAAAQREVEQLKRLRDQLHAESQRGRQLRRPAPARTTAEAEKEELHAGARGRRIAEGAAPTEEPSVTGKPNLETPQTVDNSDEDDVTEAVIATGWALRPLPAPTYANQPSLPRRQVVAQEETSAPEAAPVRHYARPVAASPAPLQAQSSAEAAQEAPVCFDLEEVLESRRAQ